MRRAKAATPWQLVVLALAGACGGGEPQAGGSSLTFHVELSPSPPSVGETRLLIRLSDAEAKPVPGATMRIEGTMSHAGMTPEFANAVETSPGSYEAVLDFTMGGDWILLMDATTRDGRKHHGQHDVPNVASKRARSGP
jgi:hypothetical protein